MNKILKWFKRTFIPHEENGHRPHFLRARSLFSIFLFVVIAELILVGIFFQIIPMGKFLGSLVMTDVLIDLTNENRQESGLQELKYNPLLQEAARLKAEDMASKGYFAHTSPEGIDPWYWFDLVGYDFIYAGENLAVNFFDSHDINRAWMNSPKHKQNIVNVDFNEIGIGTARGEHGGRESIFVVQLFGTSRNNSARTIVDLDLEEKKEENNNLVKENNVLGEAVSLNEFPVKKDLVVVEKEESFIYLDNNINDTYIEEEKEEVVVMYSSLMARTISSPKRAFSLMLTFLSVILLVSLTLKIFVKIKTQFPVLIIDGVLVLIVIMLALVFNDYMSLLMGQIY